MDRSQEKYRDLGKFLGPFRCCICGPSESGKTVFIANMLRNSEVVFDCKYDFVFYMYPANTESQSRFDFIEEMERKIDNFFPYEQKNLNDLSKNT